MLVYQRVSCIPNSISRNKNKVEDARAASPDADKVLAVWKHMGMSENGVYSQL